MKYWIYDGIPIETLADRTKLVVQSAFNGRRVVICSGGDSKETDAVFAEVKELNAGGAFGSIMGRNSFRRPEGEAIEFLHKIQDIYAS